MEQSGNCSCTHHMTTPVLVILFALIFLFGALGYISEQTVAISWPIIVGLAGILKLIERKCNCC